MASIKKDEKRGTYFFILEAGRDPITGKRKQVKRTGFTSKKEATSAMAQLQVEIENGVLDTPSDMKLMDYVINWFDAKKIGLKSSTRRSYDFWINYYIIPILGQYKMSQLNEKIIQDYINELLEEKELAPTTVRKSFTMLRSIIEQARRKKIITDDILAEIVLPRETTKINVWTEEEINIFLSAYVRTRHVPRAYIGFVIALLTGMRQGEVLGLRWKDIDFDNKLIFMRQTLSTDGSELQEGGKTFSSARTIHIPDVLVERLKEHKQVTDSEKRKLGVKYKDFDLVVCTKYGNPMLPPNFRNAFQQLSKKLKLPKIRFHDLRHSHATFLLTKNVNPKIVSERLGHATVSITLNTYSHVLPNMQKTASHKIDEAFNQNVTIM